MFLLHSRNMILLCLKKLPCWVVWGRQEKEEKNWRSDGKMRSERGRKKGWGCRKKEGGCNGKNFPRPKLAFCSHFYHKSQIKLNFNPPPPQKKKNSWPKHWHFSHVVWHSAHSFFLFFGGKNGKQPIVSWQ